MEFVRSHGYPAPEVFDVSDDGFDLVMERINGPTMLDMAASKPWRIRSLGQDLAKLQISLHAITAPQWLVKAPFGNGDRILHLDLHPLNVMIGPEGPVVIDWTNAARGDPLADIALSWALIASGELPADPWKSRLLGVGRTIMLNAFLKPFRGDDLRAMLKVAVTWKCRDSNMSPTEIERMRSML